MSEAKAKEQAWLDFQEIAEETQQSSRPDLISMQQAGPMGRLILAWQNTPMQMTRLTKKKLSDLVNRRRIPGYTQLQSDMANIQGIIYYGVVQNLIFGAMQTGLMFLLFGWDDEERKKKLELRTLNGALDTLLRGTGIYGAAVSTLKNVLLKWKEEREGPAWKRDDWNIAQEAINLSPPIGSKMRKLMGAIRTEKYNPGVSKEIGFRIENPNLSIAANWTEALTNIPVARVVNKANNVEEALNSNHDIWQRVAMASGWSRWSVGVEDEELKAAKETVKEKRAEEKKKERKKKKEEKKKEEQKKAPKRYKCRKRKADGNRCKNTTTHKSQYCYAHR
jgi:flagellar biosynthesis GTPase FlhF